MKRANALNSKVMYLPGKVYDIDSEGDENWKDDTIDAQIEDSFEYSKDEGKTNYIEKKETMTDFTGTSAGTSASAAVIPEVSEAKLDWKQQKELEKQRENT